MTCSHAKRSRSVALGQSPDFPKLLEFMTDSKGFSRFVAVASAIAIIQNCWNFP
ncbi:MAG: hypothetical protein F6K26_54955 [Moorea sp. SIO2I5]|nr:hypothetical protein [Moorena sp. SIO2I5]